MDNQAIVSLRRLEGGFLHLPMAIFVQGSDAEDVRRVPSMAWLIEHQPSKKKVIFDMGLRKDVENYPPGVFHRLQTVIKCEVPEDVFDSLGALQVNPQSDVDAVIFSHLHYDHIGDPSRLGPQVDYILGPGAKDLISGPKAYPADPNSHFDSQLLPVDHIVGLPATDDDGSWVPFGPFPHTFDYFGDKSLLIVDAAGHCEGHINALLRIDQQRWIYLAGDTTHDGRILQGTAETAVYWDKNTGKTKCAHVDKELAGRHLQRVRDLKQFIDVEIILSHDSEWYASNRSRF